MRYKKIKKLINTAAELGGTVYDVAESAGLFSAAHFIEQWINDKAAAKKLLAEDILPENMTAVVEAYIHFDDTEELEQIFLYRDRMQPDENLLAEGTVTDGKLVLQYDRLKKLAAEGYKCLHNRAEDGHNGRAVVLYGNAFGRNKTMLPFKLWDEAAAFAGNGFNCALFVKTKYEHLFVMPDLHTVEESIRAVHAENVIREAYDTDFRMERICMEDEKVLETLKQETGKIIGQGRRIADDKLPESYRRLYYQIAYLMTYYPREYELVWHGSYEGDDEAQTLQSENHRVSVGISLSNDVTYAVCRTTDGGIRRIPNLETPYEAPENLKYAFKGYGDIYNVGIAVSKMAVTMRNIVMSAEFFYGIRVEKAYVTILGKLPEEAEVIAEMERRKEEAESKGAEGTDLSLLAYEEMKGTDLSGNGLLQWAAERALLPEAEYVDTIAAVMQAYSKKEAVRSMKKNDTALLYEFGEEELCFALIRKISDHEFEMVDYECADFPEDEIYKEGEDFSEVYQDTFQEIYEDEFGELDPPGLKQVVWSDMDHFMLDAGLRAIGINRSNRADRKAFREIRKDYQKVKRQFVRNDSAKIIFDNGWLRMSENYPIDRLESCFSRVLRNNNAFLMDWLGRIGVSMDDISTVLLSGEESGYPFVKESLEAFTGKEVCVINAPECVAARGAVLWGSEMR